MTVPDVPDSDPTTEDGNADNNNPDDNNPLKRM